MVRTPGISKVEPVLFLTPTTTFGSVCFCRRKALTPMTSSKTATSGPASAKKLTLRPMARGGPIMKASSVSTVSREKAVCNCGLPRKSCVQRALIIAGMLGIVPASAARINNSGVGALIETATISASNMPMLKVVTKGSTRLCPR